MTLLRTDSSDATEFIGYVESLIHGVIMQETPSRFYVTKIKNWFSQRWLNFSGKVLGAAGVWESKLTLPPFIPSRVINQDCYDVRSDSYVSVKNAKKLHKWQPSGQNLSRKAQKIVPDSVLFWYSSHSAIQKRGALMAYVLTNEAPWTWYLEIQKKSPHWKVSYLKNISPNQFEDLINHE